MSVPEAPADPWYDPAGTRLVGDPVDVVTGRVTERTLCFRLIGPVFLQLYRHYDSGHNTLRRGLGFGHAHSYDHRLSFDIDGLLLEEPLGRRIGFPPLLADGEAHTARGVTLRRLSSLKYRLTRRGSPAIDFTFADPERAARVTRVHRGRIGIDFRYGPDGRLTGLTHSTGLVITAEEDDAQRLLLFAGAWDGGEQQRPIMTCSYDGAGNLLSITDAAGQATRFAYDGNNRLISRTDRRGYSFLYEYDVVGRCVRSAGEDGVMGVVLRYRSDARITEVTRSDGGLWQYYYDDNGSITQVIGPYGDARRFIKGDNGRTVGEIDPLGNSLEYVFDRSGTLAGKRCSTGRIIPMQAGVELAGAPPHRIADRYAQFLFGRLPTNLRVVRDAINPAQAWLSRMLVPEDEPPPPSVDVPPFGSLPWYPEPQGGREFSPFGHLIAQTLPGGQQRRWTYDVNDGVHTTTDADGSVTRQERRSWNQLDVWVDPLGYETRYRFTTEDQVVAVADPGGTVTEFAYDKERRLLGVRRASAVRETYCRDGAGNLIEKRDGAGATLLTLSPTADRRVAERRLASGGVHSFEYDATGRVVKAAVDFAETCFAYDRLGRRVLDARDGQGVQHNYAAGPRRETTTVLKHFQIVREKTDDGLTICMPGGGWARLQRLAEGAILRTCSNGTTELCQFDAMGRCVASAVGSERVPSRRWTRRWRYSAEGDLQEAEDSRFGASWYRFDAAHRLVSVERESARSEAYAYDAAGNLLAQPGLSDVQLGSGNRLAAANGERFGYNIRQHIAERQSTNGPIAYRYDSRDMLVAVEGPNWIWQAEYDALGRRVRAWQGELEQRFFWDTDRLAAEVFASGLLRIYVYADALALTPIAFVDYADQDTEPGEGAVRFVICDQRGAPVAVEDAMGTMLWEARLTPYGAATINAVSGLVQNLRFPGHYFDAATGLHYNRFRYYDPVLGRYVQSDPLGLGGGLNVYAYPANPLVRVDVRGLTGGTGGPCENEIATPPPEAAEDDESPTPRPVAEDENSLENRLIAAVDNESLNNPEGLSKRAQGPFVAGVADTETGDIFTARNRRGPIPPDEMHPITAERVAAQQALIDEYRGMTPDERSQIRNMSDDELHNMLNDRGIPSNVAGVDQGEAMRNVDSRAEFNRERNVNSGRDPDLTDAQWDAMRNEASNHAEVDAMNQALNNRQAAHDADPSVPPPDAHDLSDFLVHVDRNGTDESGPRCHNCGNTTSGMTPTGPQREADNSIPRRVPPDPPPSSDPPEEE